MTHSQLKMNEGMQAHVFRLMRGVAAMDQEKKYGVGTALAHRLIAVPVGMVAFSVVGVVGGAAQLVEDVSSGLFSKGCLGVCSLVALGLLVKPELRDAVGGLVNQEGWAAMGHAAATGFGILAAGTAALGAAIGGAYGWIYAKDFSSPTHVADAALGMLKEKLRMKNVSGGVSETNFKNKSPKV